MLTNNLIGKVIVRAKEKNSKISDLSYRATPRLLVYFDDKNVITKEVIPFTTCDVQSAKYYQNYEFVEYKELLSKAKPVFKKVTEGTNIKNITATDVLYSLDNDTYAVRVFDCYTNTYLNNGLIFLMNKQLVQSKIANAIKVEDIEKDATIEDVYKESTSAILGKTHEERHSRRLEQTNDIEILSELVNAKKLYRIAGDDRTQSIDKAISIYKNFRPKRVEDLER